MRIGVALSGGGHRASLFAAGVLQYLADAGRNRQVVSVASVSGGSITNAVCGQAVDYPAVSGDRYAQRVTTPLLETIACTGTLWTAATRAYLVALVLAGLATFTVPWILECLVPLPWWVSVPLFVVGLVGTSWLAWQRGRVCVAAFNRTLFSAGGRPRDLSALRHGSIEHVLCATDLRSGENLYFTGDKVVSYCLGQSTYTGTELAVCVHASAALPFAFPPQRLSARPFAFSRTWAVPGVPLPQAELVLVDGGVYDNLADQWVSGQAADAERRYPVRDPDPPGEGGPRPGGDADRRADTLIVANASAGPRWVPYRWARVPLVGEVMALARDKSILYANTTAPRKVALQARFDQAALTGRGLHGAYVAIDESPFEVADSIVAAGAQWPDRLPRARRVLDRLGDTREEWKQVAAADTAVATTLSRISPTVTARLVRHAYVTAMCNLHVLLDFPLLDVPGEDRFLPTKAAGGRVGSGPQADH